MKIKVLVTGGAGYIGNVLIQKLLNFGYEVKVIDNLMYDQTELIAFANNEHFEFIYGDVTDEMFLYKWVNWADVIFPLAALVGAPICRKNYIMAEAVNRRHVENIARWAGNRKVIYPNTNSGYGIGSSGVCTEESPLEPITHYGKTKALAESTVLANKGVVFRLATVFGVSDRMRLDLLVNDFVYKAVTNKSIVLFESHFKRNYIHVQDVANAFLFAIDHYDDMKGQAYNLGLSTANLSKYELCLEIKKIHPDFVILESEIGEDPDKRNYIVSNDKIQSIGWEPRFSLQNGIWELTRAYKILTQVKNRFGNN